MHHKAGSHLALLAVDVAILTVLASGCGGGLVVSQLTLTGTPDGWRPPGLNPVVLQGEIVEAGKRDGVFVIKRDTKDGWNMKVNLEHLPEAIAAASRIRETPQSGIDIKIQRYLKSGDLDSMAVSIPITESEAASILDSKSKERLIASLIVKGVSMLETQIEFRKLDTTKLVRQLASKESWRRAAAIEELGLRKEKSSLPKVIQELKDPERGVSMKAVGALVSMANPEAVPALIEFSKGKDSSTQIQVIYALSQIGGPVAEGYLFVVSTGHANPNIAAAAADALTELENRKVVESGSNN